MLKATGRVYSNQTVSAIFFPGVFWVCRCDKNIFKSIVTLLQFSCEMCRELLVLDPKQYLRWAKVFNFYRALFTVTEYSGHVKYCVVSKQINSFDSNFRLECHCLF